MSEVAIYEPPGAPLPARTGVPGSQDFDSWTAVASEVIKLANVIYDTPFVPDGLRSGPAVAAAILAGRELGLGPMTALANVHVIKGKPGLSAVLMRALILAQGHYWHDVEVSDTRCVIEGRRRNETEWTRVAFTADQARQAKIDLGGYPQDKLYARATARLARRKFADVIAGMPYSTEELEDGVPPGAMLAGESYRDEPRDGNGQAPSAPAPARTARRRQPAEPRPTPAAPAAATAPTAAPVTAQTAPSGLPPLPGEDEPDPTAGHDAPTTATTAEATAASASPADAPQAPFDPDEHGTATKGKGGQLTALWTVLSTVFSFEDREKEQARGVCEHIIGRDLPGTTGDMSWNEARTVLDTLANWQKIAESRGREPRETLIEILAESGKAVAGDG